MKNVTITLEDDVALWARIRAARRNTSVSKLVGEMLKEFMQREEEYENAMKDFFSTPPARISKSGRYPRREQLYDRKILR